MQRTLMRSKKLLIQKRWVNWLSSSSISKKNLELLNIICDDELDGLHNSSDEDADEEASIEEVAETEEVIIPE